VLGAILSRGSAFGTRYPPHHASSGHKKAVVAVAHATAGHRYHVLARPTAYREPGTDYGDRRYAQRLACQAVATLERQDYQVTIERVA
jgi:hypothetical protein